MIQDVMLFVLQFVSHLNVIPLVKNQKLLFVMLNVKGNKIINELNFHIKREISKNFSKKYINKLILVNYLLKTRLYPNVP